MFQPKKHGAIDVVTGETPLTHESIAQFRAVLESCLETGQPRAVFDMQQVPLIDSQGLEAMLDLQEQFESLGGSIRLANPPALCQEILDVTEISHRFEIYPDVRSAVRSFLQ